MFKRELENRGIKDIEVESAGIANVREGDPPMPEAIAAMERRGINISHHKAKKLTREIIAATDFFVCPSESMASTLKLVADPVKIFRFQRDILTPGDGGAVTFDRCLTEIERCLDELYYKRVEVRAVPMEEKHIPEIFEIEKSCFNNPWTEEILRSELTLDTSRFFAAVNAQGRVVGYVGANNNAGEVYIGDIAVAADYRRRGAASVLLNKLCGVVRAEGAEFVSLEVREHNIAAIGLYENCGFVYAGKRPHFYTAPTEAAVVMTKTF